ncbi:hypothetical protein [Mesorhizobium sp.]|uniref:hypothetical protein n=1 Tax=Mesorhizobium sp. TaxID=1871066 RepID=UPI000FE468C4|nr:hypothetical protein [Mesorhizobium sp.]RWM74118.1 MAG: hypothetical protein EOR82_09235 [Mesorhizobium sp.]TIO27370.1 MAG: hypothetical protein E5X83_03115 [Mesorhizobium sp.]TJV64440.1 MAG: hypothetical protein E5X82_01535 [Mesorhizobium sp.]
MQLDEMRILCAKHWNPIGIPMENVATSNELGFRPLPEDEYDSYLQQIMRLIVDGASPNEISNYLATVESEYLMLDSPAGSKDDFVSAVLELDKRTPTQ